MDRRSLLVALAILGLGLLAGRYLLPGDGPAPDSGDTAPPQPALTAPAAAPGMATEILEQLQQRLLQGEQERERLAGRLAELETLLETTETHGKAAETPDTGDGRKGGTDATALRSSVESLIAAGIKPEQATRIQALLDENDLQQLYLRDRATREGWINTGRYNKERRQYLNAHEQLRPEIGDDAYDRLLYTLKRPNRVVVRDTMQNSPGEQYGLQSGDRILEYDGVRVFNAKNLNELVTMVTPGTMVLVRVLRDGEPVDFYLPQGPMGVRLATALEQP